jgi:hypothetical protein
MVSIITRVQRSIYDLVRLQLVQAGLTPDVTAFEDTAASYQAYLQALKDIKVLKGYAVELFGQSPQLDKGLEKVPRISLSFATLQDGDWGMDPWPIITDPATGFSQSVISPLISMEMVATCHIITNKTSHERYLENLAFLAIPPRGFVKFYDNDEKFLVQFASRNNYENSGIGVRESHITFSIPDILITEAQLFGNPNPPITDIFLGLSMGSGLADYLHITNL